MISAIAHKTTVFILVFILLAQNVNTIVIIGDFVINQDLIAKTLCIEKDNQQGCNGKCQLSINLQNNQLDTNSELPAQEMKRLALDVFDVAPINSIFEHIKYYSLSQKIMDTYDVLFIQTVLNIDTPPPIFA